MELKDPITNTTIDEKQLAAATALTTAISPSDDENSSIITVRSNESAGGSLAATDLKLHLATNDDVLDMAASKNIDRPNVGTFVSTTTRVDHLQQVDGNQPLQTIVEVVNPLITGDGYANRIAVGHTPEPTYPSFDANDNGNVADDEYDSYNAYNPSNRLSLNDKMKNVLQELVTNERVRLSFSQSITEDDDDDEDNDDEEQSEEANDTDDDEHEPLQFDEHDGGIVAVATSSPAAQSPVERNGNEVIARVIISSPTPPLTFDANDTINVETITIATIDEPNNDNVGGDIDIDADDDDLEATSKDIKNANVVVVVEQQRKNEVVMRDIDDNIVYENPNFLAANCEIDDDTTKRSELNERNEKLKEKLLSELNIDERRNVIPAAIELVDQVVDVAAKVINKEGNNDDNKQRGDDEDEDDGPSEATTSTETSNRSANKSTTNTGAGGKRKKRKSKGKKK